MEKKDFPKGPKPRGIFVYTCERIAEPLIPLGYKYRKSKNDIYKKDGIFVFSFYFSPSIRFGSTTFTAFFDVSSPVIAQWRSEQEGTEETYDGIVGTSIARLTRRYDDFPRYEVSTLLERERSIQEISGQIQDYDQKENSCEIFEIKHSSKQVPFQYRHLVDEDKCQRTERRFGPIQGRYILYRGEDAQMENGVQYWNVENYLKALPTLDIVQVQEIGMQSIEPTL